MLRPLCRPAWSSLVHPNKHGAICRRQAPFAAARRGWAPVRLTSGQYLQQFQRIINGLSFEVVVEEDVEFFRVGGHVAETGEPLAQFFAGIAIVVALFGAVVFPPFFVVTAVESDVGNGGGDDIKGWEETG